MDAPLTSFLLFGSVVVLLLLTIHHSVGAFSPTYQTPNYLSNRVVAAPFNSVLKLSSEGGGGESDGSASPGDDEAGTAKLKESLLESIQTFRELQERDGDLKIDFGVKGGELNETSRAPQKVNYYAISKDVGDAAQKVMDICDLLQEAKSPLSVPPTSYFGNKTDGNRAPLNGTWKLLFTTAADASFTSKNSTRGTAQVSNVIDGTTGRLTNVIQFQPKPDGTKPPLDQLNVVIQGTASSSNRIDLKFKYAKVYLNKFFGLPLFGKRLRLYIPVPGPFITRLIVLFGRIIKFGKGNVKKPPQAYFDIMYLDENLRIQKTGEDNLFVQAKESWDKAKPLMQ